MSESPLRSFVVPLLLISILLPGCTRTVEHKVARVSPTIPPGPTTRPAPETAAYTVKVRMRADDDYHALPNTTAIITRGEILGFHIADDGTIIALAGEETFSIDLPPGWRRRMWHATYEQQTQFGRDLKRGVAAAVRGAFVGTLWVTKEMLESDDELDDGPMIKRLREIEKIKERRRRD